MSSSESQGMEPRKRDELEGVIHLPDDQAEQAYTLRLQGKNSNQIAAQMLITPSQVRQLIARRFKTESSQISNEDRQGMLQMEIDRIDALMNAHWDQAMYGDPKSSDVILKCIATRAKLLQLDVVDPQTVKNQVLVVGGDTESFVKALQRAQED